MFFKALPRDFVLWFTFGLDFEGRGIEGRLRGFMTSLSEGYIGFIGGVNSTVCDLLKASGSDW